MSDTEKKHPANIEGKSEEFNLQDELKKALARIRGLTGLKLTNIEKIDLRKKIEHISQIPPAENPWSYVAPWNEAAIWFLKENYADFTDAALRKFWSEINRGQINKGANWIES